MGKEWYKNTDKLGTFFQTASLNMEELRKKIWLTYCWLDGGTKRGRKWPWGESRCRELAYILVDFTDWPPIASCLSSSNMVRKLRIKKPPLSTDMYVGKLGQPKWQHSTRASCRELPGTIVLSFRKPDIWMTLLTCARDSISVLEPSHTFHFISSSNLKQTAHCKVCSKNTHFFFIHPIHFIEHLLFILFNDFNLTSGRQKIVISELFRKKILLI